MHNHLRECSWSVISSISIPYPRSEQLVHFSNQYNGEALGQGCTQLKRWCVNRLQGALEILDIWKAADDGVDRLGVKGEGDTCCDDYPEWRHQSIQTSCPSSSRQIQWRGLYRDKWAIEDFEWGAGAYFNIAKEYYSKIGAKWYPTWEASSPKEILEIKGETANTKGENWDWLRHWKPRQEHWISTSSCLEDEGACYGKVRNQ